MPTTTELILDHFVQVAIEADTPKEQIIADLNVVVGSSAVALEIGRPDLAPVIFESALARQGTQIVGGVDRARWREVARIAAANLSTDSTDPDHILADLSYWKNPYRFVAKASHPSGEGSEL